MHRQDIPVAGVALAVSANAMFALIAMYSTLLPMSGLDTFCWRVIWTLPFTLSIIACHRQFDRLLDFYRELRGNLQTASMLVGCSALLALQQWLFVWAPGAGRMIDVSMGYFILPITMVLTGWIVDRQHIHALQWLAVACALIGVAFNLLESRAFAWPTLVVALGFPPYFLLRRKLRQDSLTVFAAESIIMVPFAAMFALRGESLRAVQQHDNLAFLLPGLGALSAAAFVSYLGASRALPIALFGLLGYVEPMLLLGVSLYVFGETMTPRAILSGIPIALSVVLTAVYVTIGVVRAKEKR